MKRILTLMLLTVFIVGSVVVITGCGSDNNNDITKGHEYEEEDDDTAIDLSPEFLEGRWYDGGSYLGHIFIQPNIHYRYRVENGQITDSGWNRGTYIILTNTDPNDVYPDGEYVEYTLTESYNHYTGYWNNMSYPLTGQLYNSSFKYTTKSTDTAHP
jgi:hypothetical protein